jgi:hypothetical protein
MSGWNIFHLCWAISGIIALIICDGKETREDFREIWAGNESKWWILAHVFIWFGWIVFGPTAPFVLGKIKKL